MKKLITLCMFTLTLYCNAQTTPQPNWIIIHNDGKTGVLDTDGTILLPPVYDEIQPFDEVAPGLAVIIKDGLAGLTDTDGLIIVCPVYNYITTGKDYNPDWLMVEKEGKFGFIDFDGNIITEPVYDEFLSPVAALTKSL